MHPRIVLAVLAVLLLIAALLVVPQISREIAYVGQAGVSHHGSGGRTVHLNTCGESATRVTVETGEHTVSYTPVAPFSGVVAFELGAPAPQGWTVEDTGEGGDVGKQTVVNATLHERPDTHRFRRADVAAADLRELEPGRIAVGTRFASGDRELAWPEQFARECPGPVRYSPGLGSNFS